MDARIWNPDAPTNENAVIKVICVFFFKHLLFFRIPLCLCIVYTDVNEFIAM